MAHGSYAAVVPNFSHHPGGGTVLALDVPARIRGALSLLREAESYEDARAIARLVKSQDDKVLLLAAMRGKLHYPRCAVEAVAAEVDEDLLVKAFGWPAAMLMLGTDADV